MFVSSYSTYINPNSTEKISREKNEEYKKSSSSFSEKLASKPVEAFSETSLFPINYVSNYKVLNNQQKLQESYQNTKNSEKLKFSKFNKLSNAKSAYSENTKLFSLHVKPNITLDQTPKIDKNSPKNHQEAKEQAIRHTMINTYIANENYYKITA